jgi:hypothetical protein
VSKPNPGGYVTSLFDVISRELGQEFAMGRDLIQQQLPREFEDGTV